MSLATFWLEMPGSDHHCRFREVHLPNPHRKKDDGRECQDCEHPSRELIIASACRDLPQRDERSVNEKEHYNAGDHDDFPEASFQNENGLFFIRIAAMGE
ncbi:hypothetical protein N2599_24115 (plasmid) [Rhizobium sullae]|uniref:Uncharacterized protein n=1 Tax=Rhizobium sullae TaxID=50338 RepID=A0ABY5XVP3_RHISU|nr:hypothetical protein [Rhizobium sullae]UWU18331.1 hypothetical protein N2599_24115 [Rhizobium sullae]